MVKTYYLNLEFTQKEPQVNERVLGYSGGLYEIFTYAGKGWWLKHDPYSPYRFDTQTGPEWWAPLPYWGIKEYANREMH
jgi:hypothetical protein